MPRNIALALTAAAVLTVLVAAPVIGFFSDGPNGEKVLDLLDDAGIATDAATLDALADTYGLGGAVRILAFADAAGVDPDDVAAMFDAGMGWGQIARELDLEIGPGIGWIMSGHGKGQGSAGGQGHGHGWGPGGNPAGGDDEDEGGEPGD